MVGCINEVLFFPPPVVLPIEDPVDCNPSGSNRERVARERKRCMHFCRLSFSLQLLLSDHLVPQPSTRYIRFDSESQHRQVGTLSSRTRTTINQTCRHQSTVQALALAPTDHALHLNMSDRETLISMGFPESHVSKALQSTRNSGLSPA